jgi:hypothetical protein
LEKRVEAAAAPLQDNSGQRSKDEGGQYFVFRFTKCDPSYPLWGRQEIGRFTVLSAMIEDGIISEQQLHAALWHTLGQIRGMA